MKFENLTNEILNNNRVIKVFLSGGRLRVARVDDLDTTRIYGEGPYFTTALTHADENCVDKLDYQGQYGVNGKHEHYLTGGPMITSDVLDYSLFFGKILIYKRKDINYEDEFDVGLIEASFVTKVRFIKLSANGMDVEEALSSLEEVLRIIGVETLGELV